MSLRIRLIIAFVCACIAGGIVFQYAQTIRADAQKMREDLQKRYGGEIVQLVVTTKALQVGDTISKEDISTRDWLSELAPFDAYTSEDEVLGKTVKAPIAGNVPLSKANFSNVSEETPIPEGYVALNIPMSEKLGIGMHVAPHTAVVAYEATHKSSELITKDALVLYSQEDEAGHMGRMSCVIALRPEDVERVLTASAKGSLKLVVPAPQRGAESSAHEQGGANPTNTAPDTSSDESDTRSEGNLSRTNDQTSSDPSSSSMSPQKNAQESKSSPKSTHEPRRASKKMVRVASRHDRDSSESEDAA